MAGYTLKAVGIAGGFTAGQSLAAWNKKDRAAQASLNKFGALGDVRRDPPRLGLLTQINVRPGLLRLHHFSRGRVPR
jgi:hypothetical protein